MLGTDFKFEDKTKAVTDAAEKATFKNVGHAAAAIRKTAIDSIASEDGPSAPGTPPHTHTGGITKSGKVRRGAIQKAIAYAADIDSAVLGPRFSILGIAGRIFEFADNVHGDNFAIEERPYLGPALAGNLDRFASSYAGSI